MSKSRLQHPLASRDDVAPLAVDAPPAPLHSHSPDNARKPVVVTGRARSVESAQSDIPVAIRALENLQNEAVTYVSVRQLGNRWSVSVPTIWRWAATMPDFPKPISLSPGSTRWQLGEVIAFERSRRKRS